MRNALVRVVSLAGAAWLCWALVTAPAVQAQRLHTVRAGQTLASIARRYGVSVADLAAANRLGAGATIRVGQELRVPARGVVFVRPGQTLSHIARAHGCSVEALARANRMRVSQPVRVGQRLVLPGYQAVTPGASEPEDWGEPEEPGVVHVRTREGRVRIRLVDELGRVPREGLVALGQAMQRADEQGGDVRTPEPRLAVLLAAISDHFGGREIRVVSGFREVGGYTRETSRHVQGRAADIRVAGVAHRHVWDYCRSLSHTGCGLYPRSTFVHVDVRESNGQWVDWSAPGRRARYGTLRGPYGRRQRRSPDRPRVGRQVTRPDEVPLQVKIVGAPEERAQEALRQGSSS